MPMVTTHFGAVAPGRRVSRGKVPPWPSPLAGTVSTVDLSMPAAGCMSACSPTYSRSIGAPGSGLAATRWHGRWG
jgi:hypothetical protein